MEALTFKVIEVSWDFYSDYPRVCRGWTSLLNLALHQDQNENQFHNLFGFGHKIYS